ncbi:MAG: NACHT domain-containing protein [Bacteroidota bacterium]
MTLEQLLALDWLEVLEECVKPNTIRKALDRVRDTVNSFNHGKNEEIVARFNIDDIQKIIGYQLSQNLNWARSVSFRDAIESKSLEDIFIDIDFSLAPLNRRLELHAKEKKVGRPYIYQCLNHRNVVILGQPGGGKTTLMKRVFLDLLLRKQDNLKNFNFPLAIKLKEFDSQLKGRNGLYHAIFEMLGISIIFPSDRESEKQQINKLILTRLLDDLGVLLILDGYDEVTNEGTKKFLVANLTELTNSLRSAKFLFTSRSADYNHHLENSVTLEICPLGSKQIKEFVQAWLKDVKKANKLLRQLRKSPYSDTITRPLTIATLCALFERDKRIPVKPKSVYKKLIDLYLEDWNNQRGVERISKYSSFDPYRKLEFLEILAFYLTTYWKKIVFDSVLLEKIYEQIWHDFDLDPNEAKYVVKEIESHTGLIVQTSIDSYEFSHRSLQEFLVASYIVKFPQLPKTLDYDFIPGELAVSISLSSKPSLQFYIILNQLVELGNCKLQFLSIFFDRILIEKPDFDTHVFGVLALIQVYDMVFATRRYEISPYTENILEKTLDIGVFRGINIAKDYISRFYHIFEYHESQQQKSDIYNFGSMYRLERKELEQYPYDITVSKHLFAPSELLPDNIQNDFPGLHELIPY